MNAKNFKGYILNKDVCYPEEKINKRKYITIVNNTLNREFINWNNVTNRSYIKVK